MFKFILPGFPQGKLGRSLSIRIPENEKPPTSRGVMMQHQRVISEAMRGASPIESMLIVHDMGTGKTCTSVFAIERNLKDATFGTQRAIVLNRGRAILGNYVRELVERCTTSYDPKKSWEKTYSMYTFEMFAKMIEKLSDENIISKFNNSFIVIDEVHNLVNEDSRTFSQIFRFVTVLDRKKLLLMTGTPVKDSPSDFAPILSLLSGKRIPQATFETEFYDNSGNLNENFKSLVRNKVSYLASAKPEVFVSVEGSTFIGVKNASVHYMSGHQEKYYLEAHDRDLKGAGGGVYNNSRQAARLVFPDGSYGSEGFYRYVVDKKFFFKKNMTDFLNESGTDLKSRLSQIAIMSEKYSWIIANLIETSSRGEKSIVYDDLVRGSGLIVFSLLLKFVGFKNFKLVTSETATNQEIADAQKAFNNGELKVIIGSRVISEGFTFKDVLHEHVVPHWNNTETSQVIARGIRMGSHPKTKGKTVRVYKHMSVPKSFPEKSVDYIMMKISQEKQQRTDKILSVLKSESTTCESFSDRNNFYTCAVDQGSESSDEPISPEDNRILVLKIMNLFKSERSLDISEIAEKLKINFDDTASKIYLVQAVGTAVNECKRFVNDAGISVMMFRDGDTVFTSESLGSDATLAFYSGETRPQFKQSSLQERFHSALPIEQWRLDHRFLEIVLTAKLMNLSLTVDVDKVLSSPKFSGKWSIQNGVAVARYGPTVSRVGESTFLENPKTDKPWNEWKKYLKTDKNPQKYIETERKILEDGWRFYGQKNPISGDFCMKEINVDAIDTRDHRKRSTGKRCINWDKKSLIAIAQESSLGAEKSMTRNKLCDKIEKFFASKKILIEDKFCGVQYKIKK